MKRTAWLLMCLLGSTMAVAANSDVVVNSDVTNIEKGLAEGVKAKMITVEQAKEMGLNRAESYNVSSTVSVDNLEILIKKKLQDSKMPYYSIQYNNPINNDEAYTAVITEYFSKVD
ncbi:hypothetical protein [Photobacterium nomapromontoriensis]|uniref:hypothetical protein n=1 Tax=Photobacterium nomapromontoriensis TaxID=2910237 RepID=UPI003D0B6D01